MAECSKYDVEANQEIVQKAGEVAKDAKVTYLEALLVRALLKTDLASSRSAILKYKGRHDEYDVVLEQVRAGCESALSSDLDRSEKRKNSDEDQGDDVRAQPAPKRASKK